MAAPSKTKSHFERLLIEIYARRFSENTQRVCIDCLKKKKKKKKKIGLSVKNVVTLSFMCSIIKILHL